jgi:putative ABC transport system substrate-binding protein
VLAQGVLELAAPISRVRRHDFVDVFRQAASYVDGILRGNKPADLPVQAPTKYETTIKVTTAKSLGLTIPSVLLVAADELIE